MTAIPLTAYQLMSVGLAQEAVLAALELLHTGGYPRPTEEQCRQLSHAIVGASLAMPHMVADMAATTDEQLEGAARDLGYSAVRELLGPPPMAV